MEERLVEDCRPETTANIDDSSYKRAKQEILKDWEIYIRFHSIGCVVSVGCVTIPFESIEAAMQAIKDYTEDPEGSKKYWENKMKDN